MDRQSGGPPRNDDHRESRRISRFGNVRQAEIPMQPVGAVADPLRHATYGSAIANNTDHLPAGNYAVHNGARQLSSRFPHGQQILQSAGEVAGGAEYGGKCERLPRASINAVRMASERQNARDADSWDATTADGYNNTGYGTRTAFPSTLAYSSYPIREPEFGTRGYADNPAAGNGVADELQSPFAPLGSDGSRTFDSRYREAIHDRGFISGLAHEIPTSFSSSYFDVPSDTNFVSDVAHELPAFPSSINAVESSFMDIAEVTHRLPAYSSVGISKSEPHRLNMLAPYVTPPVDTYDSSSPHYRYKDELIDIGSLERVGSFLGFALEKFTLRTKRFFHRICPCFYALFYSKEGEYPLYKALLGFPFGLGVGFLFYFCVIDRLRLSAFLRFMLGAMTILIMSFGYAKSIKIRCITWLIFPCFFGKSGRTILLTMAIGALLTGPISNTMNNFKESVRTVTCMTELMIDMTRTRFELTGKPIYNIVKTFVGSKKMDRIGKQMRGALSPVKGEVENSKETRDAEAKAARMDSELGTNRNEFFKENEQKNAAKLAQEDGGMDSKAFKVDTAYLKKLDYRCNSVIC